ncbi:hypothetical protein K439DRAFT_1513339 [Ramaria rubella]|nr:hypothetical protein K439DRAFT_1513339 [Ramaria rubella]
MSAIDRHTLWSSGHDESVEVNQRALIDKVLARYSGEFTVFRELLQNSDDAASKAVEIRFETKTFLNRTEGRDSEEAFGSLDLKQPVHQWTFRNNGLIFREEDWSRLKKIAEGNPDEEKIGAFGVGFYSLFSVTEEPFVKSGNQWMGFYWKDKKDQLFARRGTLPESDHADPFRQWTTFEMGLREAASMPSAFDFIRFLTSSITFMAHLEDVTVWFDGTRFAKLTKDKGVPKELPVPGGLRRRSDGGVMTMKTVKTTSLNISAEVLRLVYTGGSEKKLPPRPLSEHRLSKAPTNTGFFSSLLSSLSGSVGSTPIIARTPPPPSPPAAVILDPMAPIMSHVVLSVFGGEVDVTLSTKMTSELHRSTKKNPPKKLRLELIYTGKDEYEASKKDEEGLFETTGSLFQGLRADLDGTGSARVFIGHATGQTTGLGGHISGRFIPTVERESIDLVDRNVAIWNKELLYVCGLLARVAYELELANVRNLWTGASETPVGAATGPQSELREWLQNRCLHALRFFAFHPSTPSAVVSNLIEAAFFASSLDGSFPIISTAGVLDARNVRAFDPVYAGFLKELPVLPLEVATNAKLMTDTLRARGMIKEVTFTDVLTELRSRPLSETEMVECLKWRIALNTDGIRPAYLAELRREFLEAAIFTRASSKAAEQVVPLSTIQTVLISRNAASAIPINGPLPDHTLPIPISRQLKSDALPTMFGWTELTIPIWLENLVSPAVRNSDPEQDMTKSAAWAETVLGVLARSWLSLPKEHQAHVVALLKDKTCIPTKFGMKLPEESYFLNANVFPDLPIVTMPKGTVVKGPLEKVLLAIGVLQHVNLQVVFHRMIRTGDWGIPDLIRYLVAVEGSLTAMEMERLRETVAFTMEELEDQRDGVFPANPSNDPAASMTMPKRRFRAMDLYEPSSTLRELGLPIIAWGATPKWRSSSEEAKFLFKLGLRRHPPLKDLLSLVAVSDPAIRQASLKYLIDNMSSKYPDYNPQYFATLAYVPALKPDGTSTMGKPLEVFIDREYATMGFSVIDTTLPAEWASKLRLLKSPPTSMIIPLLHETPPKNVSAARSWFQLLAGRLSDFTSSELSRLESVSFIPVIASSPLKDSLASIRMRTPRNCYISRETNTGFHSQLFTFIDFGSRANGFLFACGVRSEPTVDEFAQILVADPKNFYKLAGGYDRFLIELRNIAINFRGVSTSTQNQMKKTPCLVASRRVARTSTEKRKPKPNDDSEDEEEGRWEHDLLLPNKIAIIDDTVTYALFDSIFSAPQEDYIEQLYSTLGSPQLSNLVREEYKPSVEIKGSMRASETRRLVLERLPLFLHERTHAKVAIPYSWLNKPENFLVTEVGKLTLTRTLQFGQIKMVKTQEASATAEQKEKGPVQLWIGGNSQVDLYEVSNSLCRVILKMHKPNESLLFMTILSTDLRALRRRGFNVDRVLRQQKAEREEQAAREQRLLSEVNHIADDDFKPHPPQATTSLINMEHPDSSPNKMGSLFSNLRHKFQRPSSPPTKSSLISDTPPSPTTTTLPPTLPPRTFNGTTGTPDPMKPYSQGAPQNTAQGVTPHANIERNVRAAIEGCRAENHSLVQSQAQMTRVKEAMDEGYCDTMGATNLEFIGVVSKFKVFVSPQGDVYLCRQDAKAAVEKMRPAIARFGDLVLQPLVRLYNIPSTSVHIFQDWEGPLIAFNRNGSLFLNLRYYVAWHDFDVQKGDLAQAYTSWYFSLAHEIAHNLVHPHNSEHEFYFSTICEQYMMGLATLLNSKQG